MEKLRPHGLNKVATDCSSTCTLAQKLKVIKFVTFLEMVFRALHVHALKHMPK